MIVGAPVTALWQLSLSGNGEGNMDNFLNSFKISIYFLFFRVIMKSTFIIFYYL
jgi:hypothetical protein